MKSRKRSYRPLGSARRERLAILPLLENLENRLVLSQSISPLVPNNLLGAADTTLLSAGSDLQPFSLAYVWGGRALRSVAPRSDSAIFPGFFSILCSVFRDSVVTIFPDLS